MLRAICEWLLRHSPILHLSSCACQRHHEGESKWPIRRNVKILPVVVFQAKDRISAVPTAKEQRELPRSSASAGILHAKATQLACRLSETSTELADNPTFREVQNQLPDSRFFVNSQRTKICERARSAPLRGCLLRAHSYRLEDGVNDTPEDALAGDVAVRTAQPYNMRLNSTGEEDGTYTVAQS